MARTSQLSELIAQVRSRTDERSSNFVTDAGELIPWINNGIACVWEELVKANPDWQLKTTTLSTVAQTLEYPVPVDFMMIRGVEYSSGGIVIEALPFQWQERNHIGNQHPNNSVNVRYRVARSGVDGTQGRIIFRPDPGTRTYTIHYIPNPTKLVAGPDEFDGIAGFEEFVIEYACAKVRVMNDDDPTPHLNAMGFERARIQGIAHNRDASSSPRIARVRRNRRGLHRVRGVH
jgi:hypothetical protein